MEKDFFRLLRTGAKFDTKRFGSALPEAVKPDHLSHSKITTSHVVKEVFSQPADSIEKQQELVSQLRHRLRIHVAGPDVPPPMTSFSELKTEGDLGEHLKRNLSQMGFVDPTAIQMQGIPVLLKGEEMFGCAPTGSGKTAAYMIPMLMRLKSPGDKLRGIVISPSRELAKQLFRIAKKLALNTGFKVRLLTRESRVTIKNPSTSSDILVTTPLLLTRMVESGDLDLSQVEMLILDEADRLFEMGFVEHIDAVFAACKHPQVVRALFSATLPQVVEDLARSILRDPARVVVGARHGATNQVTQKLVYVGSEEGKLLAMRQLLQSGLQPPAMIFVQSVARAKVLYRELKMDGVRVGVIHSDLSAKEREDVITEFRSGELWILITTDLLARGMDFKGLHMVVNYDFPQSTISYIHRVGRAGRAGRSGEAVTFFTDEDTELLRSIAALLKNSGCDVPEWMLSLKKISKQRRKELAKRPIKREHIGIPKRDVNFNKRKFEPEDSESGLESDDNELDLEEEEGAVSLSSIMDTTPVRSGKAKVTKKPKKDKKVNKRKPVDDDDDEEIDSDEFD